MSATRAALLDRLPLLQDGTCRCCGEDPHEHTDEELEGCANEAQEGRGR